jgi:hypothetical protein
MNKRPWSIKSALLLLLALFILAGAGLHLYLGIRTRLDHAALLLEGSRAIGTVTRKQANSAYPSDTAVYTVTYTFSSTDGTLMTDTSESIPYSSWKELKVGGPIEIVFDPLRPTYSSPTNQEWPSLSAIILWTIVITSIGLFVLRLWSRKNRYGGE